MDKTVNDDPSPYNSEDDHDLLKSLWHEYNRIYKLRKLEAKLLEKAMCKIEHYIMDKKPKDYK